MIGGGYSNTVNDWAAVVSGGQSNNIAAGGQNGAIGGGFSNTVSSMYSTVGGGYGNSATANDYETIAGGLNNAVTGANGAVGGGNANIVNAGGGMIPGGAGNKASGVDSFAAGTYGYALHDGAFVWSDLTGTSTNKLYSNVKNEFNVRALGGFYINSSSFTFEIAGSTKMYLNRLGYLGVGTVNPATLVHASSGVLTVDGTGAGLNVVGGSVTASGGFFQTVSVSSGAVFSGLVSVSSFTETINNGGSSGSAFTVSWSSGSVAKLTLTANVTITFNRALAGESLTILLTQDGTGSRTVTWPTVKWPAGTAPTLTTTPSKTDIVSFFYDGTDYYGFVGGQNY